MHAYVHSYPLLLSLVKEKIKFSQLQFNPLYNLTFINRIKSNQPSFVAWVFGVSGADEVEVEADDTELGVLPPVRRWFIPFLLTLVLFLCDIYWVDK